MSQRSNEEVTRSIEADRARLRLAKRRLREQFQRDDTHAVFQPTRPAVSLGRIAAENKLATAGVVAGLFLVLGPLRTVKFAAKSLTLMGTVGRIAGAIHGGPLRPPVEYDRRSMGNPTVPVTQYEAHD